MTIRVFDLSAEDRFRTTTLDDICPVADGVLWLDLAGENAEQMRRLGEVFGFHPLAIEDASKRRQRPKVDEYADHLFIVMYALDDVELRARPELRELHVFLTRHAVITIHRHEIREIESAAKRWAAHHVEGAIDSSAMLFYTIADAIVDGYFPCIDAFGDEIDQLEDDMFAGGGAQTLENVFRMKRQLVEMRRIVAPTRDVFNAFTRRELPLLGETSLAYFQDVYDHVIRVTDSIDADRDILSSVIEVHLTLQSNQLNKTVRALTAASIVLMTLALIAGVYGMNFEYMPELSWRYGYFTTLGVMAVLGIVLVIAFRKRGWW